MQSKAPAESEGRITALEPVMCRLCKGHGWQLDSRPGSQGVEECGACKGQGHLRAEDVDQWTFADLDEDLGPGAMGASRPRKPVIPANAEWKTWMDEEDGRGYLWAELVAPAKAEGSSSTGKKRGR